MKVRVQAISDLGCVRTNNEDMLVVNGEFVRDTGTDTVFETGGKTVLVAVSDGMGGHNAGEIASEFVLRRMTTLLTELDGATTEESLQKLLADSVPALHAELNGIGRSNPEMKGLGCTFTGLVFLADKLFSVHVGDSRLYRLRGRFLTQFTADHTLRNLLKDDSIPANKIANAFGGGVAGVFFDFENLTDRVLPGDTLLLCTDGLSGEVSDEDLAGLLALELNAEALCARAKQNGGNDNISLAVISPA